MPPWSQLSRPHLLQSCNSSLTASLSSAIQHPYYSETSSWATQEPCAWAVLPQNTAIFYMAHLHSTGYSQTLQGSLYIPQDTAIFYMDHFTFHRIQSDSAQLTLHSTALSLNFTYRKEFFGLPLRK